VDKLFGSRARHTLLVLAILVGCGLRIFVCFHFNPLNYVLSDASRHWTNGLRFPRGAYSGASDPIGYQVYVCMLRRVTHDNPLLVGLSAALLSLLMPWVYYRAALELGLSKISSLLIWALIVWTPSLIAIYHYIMIETLLLLLEGAALWATVRYRHVGSSSSFLASVVLWVLAALTKPTALPVALVCLAWICWKRLPDRRVVATAAALSFVLLLPQSIRSKVALGFIAPFGNPWLIRLQHRSGVKKIDLTFFTHPDDHFVIKAETHYDMEFSSPSCYVHPLAPLSDWMIARAHENTILVLPVDSAFGERDWRRAYEKFDVDREHWLMEWRENMVLFLFAPSWPEGAVHDWVDAWDPLARWMWAPIILVVFLGNARDFFRRRFDLLPIAVTCFALFLMLQNEVTFEGRYRKPLEPLLLMNLVWIVAKPSDRLRMREMSPPVDD
jgi:hypothetical protein